MLIQWEEQDDMGNTITKNHPAITLKNAHTYARKNCRHCHQKGYQFWDNGWKYYTIREANGNTYIDRKHNNPRYIACDCLLRTLSKTGL